VAQPLLSNWFDNFRVTLSSAQTKIKNSFSGMRLAIRHTWWRSKDGWYRLTAGMEINELWAQFKVEAGESSRLYKQDVSQHAGQSQRSWKRPFKILGYLFSSVLNKLSPARRLFLLLNIILAFLAVINFHFLILTQEIEFLLAFVGLLILLALVLGDHISMKRDMARTPPGSRRPRHRRCLRNPPRQDHRRRLL
jgi:hypothetical protein